MNKTIATILLVVGIGLALFGYNRYNNSVKSINIVGLELSAEDEKGTTEAYLLIGVGALLAIGGIVGLVKK
jgi:hypothetical protein